VRAVVDQLDGLVERLEKLLQAGWSGTTTAATGRYA
jgi:hypothetical protein